MAFVVGLRVVYNVLHYNDCNLHTMPTHMIVTSVVVSEVSEDFHTLLR
jgi:hypothetical protein